MALTKSLAIAVISNKSILVLWIFPNITLLRWVAEFLDRSQVFSLSMALNVRSVVAEQIGIVRYHFNSLFSFGIVCLAARRKISKIFWISGLLWVCMPNLSRLSRRVQKLQTFPKIKNGRQKSKMAVIRHFWFLG